MEEQVNRFKELISAIIKRPAMYQVSKVEDIYLVIFGYMYAGGDKSTMFAAFIDDFREFINCEFAEDFVSKSDHDWPRLIRFYSAGDMHSIELFGQLFERFLEKSKLDK